MHIDTYTDTHAYADTDTHTSYTSQIYYMHTHAHTHIQTHMYTPNYLDIYIHNNLVMYTNVHNNIYE